MTNVFPETKGFRQQSDALAVTTRILISRIKNHIERDNCDHCRAILKEDKEAMGRYKPTAADDSNSNPTRKLGVLPNEYNKRR